MSKARQSHNFANVPNVTINRSAFDRSHGYKTTFDAGYLVPVYVDEALPGDTFNLDMTAFARLATPIKPIMDNLYMETFFFAVPYRLVWDNWQKFMGERENPEDTIDYMIPQTALNAGQGEEMGLYDYMGIPIYNTATFDFSALPFRAYNLIYNEWFRDENLQMSLPVPKGDGPDDQSTYKLKRRGKRHDYFTSCLPWPQKGEHVQIPVHGFGEPTDPLLVVKEFSGAIPTFQNGADAGMFLGWTQNDQTAEWQAIPQATARANWDNPGLKLDPENKYGSINDLRIAEQLQVMLERDARGGTRYTEVIKSHFGVTSPDSRLQRPEFLGGGTSRIAIKPVEQNTQDVDGAGEQTPQGNLAAFGTATLNNHGFVKSFTEHTIIIGLVNVRADLTYQEGLERMWMRDTRYDFYWPAFANLGEQIVQEEEIYVTGAGTQSNPINEAAGITEPAEEFPPLPEHVFGYQERYADYRYKPSKITGQFRSNSPSSLDIWHLSQDFADIPQLNEEFIEDNPPVDRIIAVPSEPHFLFDSFFKLKCARPMPLYGVPSTGTRF